MTQDRDLGLMLDSFFVDGATRAPDRLMLAVTDRIERQRQRPGWLLSRDVAPQRSRVRTLAVLAAILLIALVGATALYIASPRETPGPLPVPTAPVPVVPGATAPPIPLIEGNGELAPGRYLVRSNVGPATFVVPAGWQISTMGMLDFSLAPIDAAPDDTIRVFYDMHISAKDAACTETPEPGIATTADAIVSDLVDDERIVVSPPVDVSIGGLSGKLLDVRISPTTKSTCPFMTDGSPTVALFVDDAGYVTDHPGPEITNGPFWGVDRDDRLRVVVLDRPNGGNVLFIVNSADGTTFDELVARSTPIIDSFTFDTGPLASATTTALPAQSAS
jgi:hypothetical protein